MDLKSAAMIAALMNEEMSDLLECALEIVESAYRCPEWVQWARTNRTDETLERLTAAVGAPGPEPMVQ